MPVKFLGQKVQDGGVVELKPLPPWFVDSSFPQEKTSQKTGFWTLDVSTHYLMRVSLSWSNGFPKTLPPKTIRGLEYIREIEGLVLICNPQ